MRTPDTAAPDTTVDGRSTTPAELGSWLRRCVAAHVRRDPGIIATDVPLADYGLDSVTALSVGTEIEDYLGVQLDANALWEHPTVDALVLMLVEQLRTSANP